MSAVKKIRSPFLSPVSSFIFSAVSFFVISSIALAATLPPVANLTVSGKNSNSATLTWSMPSATIDSNGSYDIRYSTQPISASSFSSATPASQGFIPYASAAPSGTQRKYTVSKLNPSTTYYFAMEWTDGSGVWSPTSNVISTQLQKAPAPSQPILLDNSGVGAGAQQTPTNVVTLGAPAAPAAAANSSAAGNAATPGTAQKSDNYTGLVKCSGVPAVDSSGKPLPGQTTCDFNAFILTIANLINWAFYISLPIAVGLFSWAGILYISGVESNISKAKAIFLNAAIGFIIMLAAFTVVHTLVGWLVDPSFGAESLLSK